MRAAARTRADLRACQIPVTKPFVRIAGRQMYLWRAVDSTGEVLGKLVQSRRDKAAAQRFLAAVANTFTTCGHLLSAAVHHRLRAEAFAARREAAEFVA